jgi:hypothetical protein
MFNALKPLSLVSERTVKDKLWMQEKDMGKLFILNYLGKIVLKLSVQGLFFFHIINYQGFLNN